MNDIIDALISSHLKKKGMSDTLESFIKPLRKEKTTQNTCKDSALAAMIGIKKLHDICSRERRGTSVLESLVHVFLNVQVSRGVLSRGMLNRNHRRVSFKEHNLVNERFYHVEDPATKLLLEKPLGAIGAGKTWRVLPSVPKSSDTVVMDSSDISKWQIGMRVHCKIPSKDNSVMPALVVNVTPAVAGSTTGAGTVEVCPLEADSTNNTTQEIKVKEEEDDDDECYNFDDDDDASVLPPGL